MISLKQATASTLGKKFLIAFGGLAWAFFLISHMVGNLQLLLLPTGDAYNRYAYFLASLGGLLYAAEAGLVATLLVHAGLAIKTTLDNRRARGDSRYAMSQTKGGPSRNTAGSRNMIVTGSVLLVFIVFHIWSFKYGPSVDEGYVVSLDGVEMRDLHRLVIERFSSPIYTFGYVAVMALLGAHLKHGFWSAFQSLGAMSPRWSRPIHLAGVAIAVGLFVGFVVAPLWIYFDLRSMLGIGGNV